jgi:uncharacterized membrane protein
MSLYLLLKWVHVLFAATALGANITYGIWIARAAPTQQDLPFTLRGIRLIDNRIATPAYGLLLVTGLLMVFVNRMRLTTPWILTALILYAIVALIGALGYTPILRRQIEALESEGYQSPGYQALARRSTLLGIFTIVLVIGIIFLMVVKPPLWG